METPSNQKNREIEFARKILFYSENGPLSIKNNDEVIMIVDLRDIIEADLETGTTFHVPDTGICEKEGLVGFGGMYVAPQMFGASSSKEAIQSWNWFLKKTRMTEKIMGMVIAHIIMDFIVNDKNNPQIVRMMSLANDIYDIHKQGIDVSIKMSEISRKINGAARSFNRSEKTSVGANVNILSNIIDYIADTSSETRLAKIALYGNLDVSLTIHPDLIIDNIGIEVKFDKFDHLGKKSLSDKINQGIKQGGKIISIETKLEKIKPNEFKITWFPVNNAIESLKQGIQIAKNNKNCVLLFTGSTNGYFARLGLIR